MPNWFTGTIAYLQPITDEQVSTKSESFIKQKTIVEQYLLDAVSHADAESRLYEEVAANTPEFEIRRIVPTKFADVFIVDGAGEDWFKVKGYWIVENERTGKQKKIVVAMLVNAESPKAAYTFIEEKMKTALDPFEITDVNRTKIVDVFPYAEKP